jgi:hypothetical protein
MPPGRRLRPAPAGYALWRVVAVFAIASARDLQMNPAAGPNRRSPRKRAREKDFYNGQLCAQDIAGAY